MPNGTPTQAPPIQAVPTSNAAFVGATGGGPDGQAVLVTSFSEYLLRFGTAGSELAQGVRLFFQNDGQRAYVVRAESHVVAALAALAGLPVNLLVLPDTSAQSAQAAANRIAGAAEVCERERWIHIVDPPHRSRNPLLKHGGAVWDRSRTLPFTRRDCGRQQRQRRPHRVRSPESWRERTQPAASGSRRRAGTAP